MRFRSGGPISESRHPSGAKGSAPYCPWPLPAKGVDLVLLLLVIGLVLFGLIMVYSASFIYAQEKTGDGFSLIRKQVIYAVLGFITLYISSRIDYRRWEKCAYPVLIIAFILLSLVLVPSI